MAVRKSKKPKGFKPAITAKVEKPYSPQTISKMRNISTVAVNDFTLKAKGASKGYLFGKVESFQTIGTKPQKKKFKVTHPTSAKSPKNPTKSAQRKKIRTQTGRR